MQLDKTEIQIRQRSTLELLDLSLLVLRRHYRPIAMTFSLLAVPLLLLDVLTIRWMISEHSLLVAESTDEPFLSIHSRYVSHLIVLFVLQLPMISVPTSVWLGNQIFYQPLPLRDLIKTLSPMSVRILLVLGTLRLGLVNLALEPLVNRSVVFDPAIEIWILFVVSAIGLIMRAFWPFSPEIIGLENCPLRSKSKSVISYSKRSYALHAHLSSDHFSRFLVSVLFSILLGVCLLSTLLFLQAVLVGSWQWNAWFSLLFLPLTLWMLGIFMTVFRFLTYLDTRIRLEGWEVLLRNQAEAARIVRAEKASLPTNLDDGKLTQPSEQLA